MGKKKNYLGIAVLSAAFIIFIIAVVKMDKSYSVPFYFEISYGTNETIELKPWDDGEGNLYVFVPSFVEGQTLLYRDNDANMYSKELVLSDEKRLVVEYGKEYVVSQSRLVGRHTYSLIFMKSENVATMVIETATGSMKELYNDKNHKEPITLAVIEQSGKVNYQGRETDVLEGRGNTTWRAEKKPFKITLSQEADLLGMGNSFNWILIANAYDQTNLRNKLVYDFCRQTGMCWSPECQYVDLYINGDYNGLFLLTEKVEVASERYFVFEPEEDILFESIELAKLGSSDKSMQSDANRYFRIDYPDGLSKGDVSGIETKLSEMEGGIVSGSLQLLDLTSWVNKYLIDEFFLNLDSDTSSNFIIYDRSEDLFRLDPVWDYDLALGNDVGTWTVLSKDAFQIWAIRKPWFQYLYSNQEFYNLVVETYKESFEPEFKAFYRDYLDNKTEEIKDASEMNSVRWNKMFKEEYSLNRTWSEQITLLDTFIKNRMNYLDSEWGSDHDYCYIRVYNKGTLPYKTIMVERGDTISNLPTASELGYKYILNWYIKGTEEVFDVNQKIESDISIYPVQSRIPVIDRKNLVCLLLIACFVISLSIFTIVSKRLHNVNAMNGGQNGADK